LEAEFDEEEELLDQIDRVLLEKLETLRAMDKDKK